eukprot:Gregarina_sp_Poly_1__10253@NODE_714_length_6642_cov_66_231939_g539_i0_p2_GENE_NODE_714_length_6642_cov_66_231939_g539_i0NODE_714_length_6642_cov_66_231939_g539_i0_p2_ORF_typecomplete_len590_score62_27Sec1/PF00995_23/9_3e75_NODE_714_length_6642_cov_66_231939_g539_i038205589
MKDSRKFTSLFVLNNNGIKEAFGALPKEPKILYVDEECKGALSMIVSFSELLEMAFYSVQLLPKSLVPLSGPASKTSYLLGVVFCRPTQENVGLLVKCFEQSKHNKYFIFFSTPIQSTVLEKLGRSDSKHCLVSKLQEMLLDFYVVRERFFSLELASVSRLMYVDKTCWQPYEDKLFQDCVSGLSSFILSVAKHVFRKCSPRCGSGVPTFHVSARSAICSILARDVLDQIQKLWGDALKEIKHDMRDKRSNSVVLIIDRREDLFSPMLNPWTYQAMLHEHIGLRLNRCKVNETEMNLNPKDDYFLRQHIDKNFGEITSVVASELKVVGSRPEGANLSALLANYSAQRQHADVVTRHATLTHYLTKVVSESKLLTVSALEQRIACGGSQVIGKPFSSYRKELETALSEAFENKEIPLYEKWRLATLYLLKFPNNERSGFISTTQLRSIGLGEHEVQLLQNIQDFGKDWYRPSEWNVLNAAKEAFSRSWQPSAPLGQYRGVIEEVLESVAKNVIDKARYPVLLQNPRMQPTLDRTPDFVVIFVVGGATFDEAREVDSFLETQTHLETEVFLGGTSVLNSKTFLADVAQIAS